MEVWSDVVRKVELSGPLAKVGAVAGSSGEGEPSKWVERHENRRRGALVTWLWAAGRLKTGLEQPGRLGCSERHAHLPPAHPPGLSLEASLRPPPCPGHPARCPPAPLTAPVCLLLPFTWILCGRQASSPLRTEAHVLSTRLGSAPGTSRR